MSLILAITELRDGNFRKVSYEVVSEAKRLAEQKGAAVTALVIGSGVSDLAKSLGQYGAANALVADDSSLQNYNPDYYKSIVLKAAEKLSPDVILFPATAMGKDLAPRVAAALDVSMASDCTGIIADGDGLEVERPLYAGKVYARAKIASSPQIISLRPGVFEIAADGNGGAGVESLDVSGLESKVTVAQVKKTGGDKLDVSEADIIVTGGRGLRSAENFAILEELAGELNAAVGATRAAVDSGWRPHEDQIGQTGKVVSPSLYIMCGASGSIQHWAGMSGSKYIVAINKDPNAPIVQRADYSIVGDLFEVVPALTKEIAKLRG